MDTLLQGAARSAAAAHRKHEIELFGQLPIITLGLRDSHTENSCSFGDTRNRIRADLVRQSGDKGTTPHSLRWAGEPQDQLRRGLHARQPHSRRPVEVALRRKTNRSVQNIFPIALSALGPLGLLVKSAANRGAHFGRSDDLEPFTHFAARDPGLHGLATAVHNCPRNLHVIQPQLAAPQSNSFDFLNSNENSVLGSRHDTPICTFLGLFLASTTDSRALARRDHSIHFHRPAEPQFVTNSCCKTFRALSFHVFTMFVALFPGFFTKKIRSAGGHRENFRQSPPLSTQSDANAKRFNGPFPSRTARSGTFIRRAPERDGLIGWRALLRLLCK